MASPKHPAILVAGAIALAALGWWFLARSGSATGSSERIANAVAAQAQPLQGGSESPRAPQPHGELVLRARGGVAPNPASVEIGIAQVDPSDAAAFAESGPMPSPGPAALVDLANVVRWIEARTKVLPNGDVVVTLDVLPRAAAYRVIAAAGGLDHYLATFEGAALESREVLPMQAAGVRVNLGTVPRARTEIELRLSATDRDAQAWLDLTARVAPNLHRALRGERIAIANGDTLAPLPPSGTVNAVLWVDGIEAASKSATLMPGEYATVAFDADAQLRAQASAVDLELEFVLRDMQTAVPGLEVFLGRESGEERQVTDMAGRALFANIDRLQSPSISWRVAAPKDPRVELPAFEQAGSLQVTFDDIAPDQRNVVRTVEVTAFRWLVVRKDAAWREAMDQGAPLPFPVFLLEREVDGEWMQQPASHFIQRDEGLAVSIEATGRYRVVVASAPWHLIRTSAASIDAGTQRAEVTLGNSTARRIVLDVTRDGRPLPGFALTLRGAERSLPAQTMTTNAAGRIELDRVSVTQFWIDLPEHEDELTVTLDAARVTIELPSTLDPASL